MKLWQKIKKYLNEEKPEKNYYCSKCGNILLLGLEHKCKPENIIKNTEDKILKDLNILADKHGVVSLAFGEYGTEGKKYSILTLDGNISCVDSTIFGAIKQALKQSEETEV